MAIDIGSGSSKGVLLADGKLIASCISPSGNNYNSTALRLRKELLSLAGLLPEDILYCAATGHAAEKIPFCQRAVSDPQACARGIISIFPSVRTVIDIQEQSSQVIRIGGDGRMLDYAADDACASGSGYSLKVIASILRLDLKDIGPLSLKSANPVVFSTGCAVFGESEAISRVSEGVPVEDILAGAHRSLVDRILSLVKKTGLEEKGAVCGGGALNIGLVKRIEEHGIKLLVPENPQLVNALGAALIAQEEQKLKMVKEANK